MYSLWEFPGKQLAYEFFSRGHPGRFGVTLSKRAITRLKGFGGKYVTFLTSHRDLGLPEERLTCLA